MLYRVKVTRRKFASLVNEDCFSRNLVLTLQRDFVALKEHDDNDRQGKDQEAQRSETSQHVWKKTFHAF